MEKKPVGKRTFQFSLPSFMGVLSSVRRDGVEVVDGQLAEPIEAAETKLAADRQRVAEARIGYVIADSEDSRAHPGDGVPDADGKRRVVKRLK